MPEKLTFDSQGFLIDEITLKMMQDAFSLPEKVLVAKPSIKGLSAGRIIIDDLHTEEAPNG
jgi:hypothetical protein